VALQVKVFHTVIYRPLLAEIILNISRLTRTKIGSVNYYIRFKKCLEQIVGDFVALKKRGKAFSYRGIGRLHEVD